MTVFKDIKNNEYVADTEIKLTEGVNGEKSLTGTIYFGNDVKKNIAKGWTMIFNDEEYAIVTFRYNDTDNTVSFSAVQMFFYTLSVKAFHEKWNGSHPLSEYLNAIFKDTGYSYINETSTAAFEKENWGLKDKLSLFNDIINQISSEFEVQGTTVYIKDKIGSDLSTVVRQGFNLSTAEIETDNSSFATYGVGYGAHDNVDDQDSPRLSVEYYSPLYDMYKAKFGTIEADPVDDERYTVTGNLLAAVKAKVDNSWSLSITVSLLDLQNAGYPYAMASAGDSITIVDESLGFEDEVRIIKVVSSYNINGERISVDVTCGDLTMAQTQSASSSVATSTITDIINGNSVLPDAWFSEQMQLATNSILAARTELKFTDQGIIAIDTTDHNKMVILNSAGVGVSTDGGQTFKTAITAESINGQNINIKNINASNIVAGAVTGKNLSINLDTGAVEFTKGYIEGSGGRIRLDLDESYFGSFSSNNNGFEIVDGKLKFYGKWSGTNKNYIGELGYDFFSYENAGINITGSKGVEIQQQQDGDNFANLSIGDAGINGSGSIRLWCSGIASLDSGQNSIWVNRSEAWVGGLKAKVTVIGSDIQLMGNTRIGGRLDVTGSKNAVTSTRDGIRATPAYEMAESYFGDMGEAKTDTTSQVKVPIETLFSDTVNTGVPYQVFIQSYSRAHVWVSSRDEDFFVVESDQPNAPFAWELKAKRRGYESDRLVKSDMTYKDYGESFGYNPSNDDSESVPDSTGSNVLDTNINEGSEDCTV